MRIKVLKVFGREVARWESWEQANMADVVAAVMAVRRMREDEDEDEEEEEDEEVTELVPCVCCGELFDPREEETMQRKFADLTDRIVWDANGDDDPPGPHHFRG